MNKDIMRVFGFDKELKKIEQGLCPFCDKKIKEGEFKDEKSEKEFELSGLCQKCQNKTFGQRT